MGWPSVHSTSVLFLAIEVEAVELIKMVVVVVVVVRVVTVAGGFIYDG